MVFRRKRKGKGMIDVRELQRKGVVRIPKQEIKVPETSVSKEGFVDFSSNSSTASDNLAGNDNSGSSNASFFGFMDNPTSTPATSSSSSKKFSTEPGGYTKREVDAKIVDLDNKIYKLEQRVELLEKKLDVNQSSNSNSSVGVMGW